MLCRLAGSLLVPVMFVALGIPFVALALRSGSGHLVVGSSASTGRLSAGIFGGCFALAGLVWGALAAARSAARLPVRSLALGLLAATLAVALALVIAATMSSAIGHAAPGKLQPVNQVLDRSAGVAGYGSSVSGAPSRAAARQTKDAVNQATVQVRKLTRLAACVSAAGANTGRIQACETRYMP